ncbi:hypothetical protein BDAP_001627 [Binucleata daphniae]
MPYKLMKKFVKQKVKNIQNVSLLSTIPLKNKDDSFLCSIKENNMLREHNNQHIGIKKNVAIKHKSLEPYAQDIRVKNISDNKEREDDLTIDTCNISCVSEDKKGSYKKSKINETTTDTTNIMSDTNNLHNSKEHYKTNGNNLYDNFSYKKTATLISNQKENNVKYKITDDELGVVRMFNQDIHREGHIHMMDPEVKSINSDIKKKKSIDLSFLDLFE